MYDDVNSCPVRTPDDDGPEHFVVERSTIREIIVGVLLGHWYGALFGAGLWVGAGVILFLIALAFAPGL